MFKVLKYGLIAVLFVLVNSVLAQQFVLHFEQENSGQASYDIPTLSDSTAFQGQAYGVVQAQHLYSCNIRERVPENFSGGNQLWQFSAAIRPFEPTTNAIFVMSFMRADTLVYYHGVKLDDFISASGQWNLIKTSFLLPATHSDSLTLKAYLWNKSGAEFQIDAIEMKVEKAFFPSFMPVIPIIENNVKAEILFANPFYKLMYSPADRTLFLADTAASPLTKPFQFFSAVQKRHNIDSFFVEKWKLKTILKSDSHSIIKLEASAKKTKTTLEIICFPQSELVDLKVSTYFKRSSTVAQNSLVIPYLDEISQVIRKTGLMDSTAFQVEYYLQHGGVMIGEGNRGIIMQNALHLSSAQLNTTNKILLLNIDYAADHPLVNFPLLKKNENVFYDRSMANLDRKSLLQGGFRLFIGTTTTQIPRFLKIPYGFEAAMVWTEHADWTNIRTHRAVNFGLESISKAENAIGGFVGYGIPVTKSIFYNNPDAITNTDISQGLFQELHSTFATDPEFPEFLETLHQLGHEICLHTPEQFTSTTANMQLALSDMQHLFGSPTWIDHGYNNKSQNNRENLVCDGLNPKSDHYSKTVWLQNGVRYFWNASVEERNPFAEFGFNGHFLMPFPGFGDVFPTAETGVHPNFPEAVLWTTTGTLEVPNDPLWDYYFHPQRLQSLVENRSVFITHVYPAWVKEGKGYWFFDADGQIRAMDGFNRSLVKVQQMGKSGSLFSTTINELLTYQEGLKYMDVQLVGKNTIQITNLSNRPIQGVSCVVKAQKISFQSKEVAQKNSQGELVVWFDLEGNESITVAFDAEK